MRDCVCAPFWPALEEEEEEEEEATTAYSRHFWPAFLTGNGALSEPHVRCRVGGTQLVRRKRRRPPGLAPSF
jgi:hypothetical protein